MNGVFSPMMLLHEGQAEWGAQNLTWTSLKHREEFLRKALGGAKASALKSNTTFSPQELKAWVELSASTDPLDDPAGSVIIGIARDLYDGRITEEKAKELMKETAFRPGDSWPNVGFFGEYGPAIVSYCWGKKLCGNYMQRHGGGWIGFLRFVRRPPPP